MQIESFGSLADGRKCLLATIENDTIRMSVSDYGATLVSLIHKPTGIDAVQGFEEVQGYVSEVPYMGATIGRVSNRIGQGKFSLNQKTYNTFINNNGNTLHGGKTGFNQKIFTLKEEPQCLVFTMISPDGDENFPGQLDVCVKYRLLENGFEYETSAYAHEDTLCSITNHAFFNLDGIHAKTALNHCVQLFSDRIGKVDENGLTLEETMDVTSTPFDFRMKRLLESCIEENHEQLLKGHGYDHNYILSGIGLKPAAVVEAETLGMKISTTCPCLHFYSANFLSENQLGKENASFSKRSSLCFETQYYPNAINYQSQIIPLVKKNETQTNVTRFEYYIKGEQDHEGE